MDDMNPCQVTPAEWKELTTVPTICDAWGIESDTTPDEFSPLVYAVKFKFASGSPGYIGELFILQGDVLTGGRANSPSSGLQRRIGSILGTNHHLMTSDTLTASKSPTVVRRKDQAA
jgi:hypothetical protein